MINRANSDQKEIVVKILSRAFDQNPSVNYVVMQDAHRERRIRKLMEYSFRVCDRFGEVWVTDDEAGCALLLFPDCKRTTFQTIRWDVELALSAIGLSRVGKVMKRETRIKAFHPDTPFCYLWFIGVDPERQAHGTGSKLLRHVIKNCEGMNRPVYLETSVVENLSWYGKFGFEVFQTLDLGYTLYLLRRHRK